MMTTTQRLLDLAAAAPASSDEDLVLPAVATWIRETWPRVERR
ncbi:hypothetical protein [Streptomyces sp. NPDC047009]